MLAWNAFSPFQNNAFTIADTVTLPLVGGPRPNPDDILCLKNLLRMNREESKVGLVANDFRPEINLRFNFAILESTVSETRKNNRSGLAQNFYSGSVLNFGFESV